MSEPSEKPTPPTSDDIRDELAKALYTVVKDGVKVRVEDAEGKSSIVSITPPASYFAAAVAYLKANPPATVPTTQSTTGVLKKHLAAVGGKTLPFPGKGPEQKETQ